MPSTVTDSRATTVSSRAGRAGLEPPGNCTIVQLRWPDSSPWSAFDPPQPRPRLRQRQRDLEAGAALRRRADGDAAVVKDDDLLHERETEAGAVALRREERRKSCARRAAGAMPGPLSLTAIRETARPASTTDSITTMRRDRRAGARFEALRSRLLNACRSSTSSPSTRRTRRAPRRRRRARARRRESRRRRARRSRADRRATSVSCAGRAKFRKLVTTWLSDSVSARMPSTYGRYGSGSA